MHLFILLFNKEERYKFINKQLIEEYKYNNKIDKKIYKFLFKKFELKVKID